MSPPPTPSSTATVAFQENPVFDEQPGDSPPQPAPSSRSCGDSHAAADKVADDTKDSCGGPPSPCGGPPSPRGGVSAESQASIGAMWVSTTARDPNPLDGTEQESATEVGMAEAALAAKEAQVVRMKAAMSAIRKRADLMGALLEDCDRMTQQDSVVRCCISSPISICYRPPCNYQRPSYSLVISIYYPDVGVVVDDIRCSSPVAIQYQSTEFGAQSSNR